MAQVGPEKARAAVWDGVPVQRCTVHRPRNLLARAPEHLHEEITASCNDMIYAAIPKRSLPAAKPSCANGGSSFMRSPTASRRQATVCSRSRAGRQASGEVPAPPTRSSGCPKNSSDGSIQTVLPSVETAEMLIWALLAYGQISMRKVDGWQRLRSNPSMSQLTSA